MKRGLTRIAVREFLGGIGRFRIYLVCLAIGAFAIAASGSVTESFRVGVTAQARVLLGGDVGFTAAQRTASAEELAFLKQRGVVTESVRTRVMAQVGDRRKQSDLRGVDNAFPLLGTAVLSGGATTLPEALQEKDGRWGIAVSASFLRDLGAKVGDDVNLGSMRARITAQLDTAPDQLGDPGAFGPLAYIHVDALRATGRLDRGQLFRATYLLKLNRPAEAATIEQEAEAAFGKEGLDFRGPEDAVDGLKTLLDLLAAFLAVVGVASLVAGGVGIAQAASAFLESRVGSIATLKAFGAGGGDILFIYLAQLSALAILGAGIGLALGAAAPWMLAAVAGDRIPLPQTLAIYPAPLLQAFVLTLLTAAAFTLPALGRARVTPSAALFRKLDPAFYRLNGRRELVFAGIASALLFVVTALTSARPLASLALLGGATGAYLLLSGAAWLVKLGARRMATRAKGINRLMLSNLGGPGSLAPTVAPALGLGLALLTLVASVQSNLLRQISETAPQSVPSLVFGQIRDQDALALDQVLASQGVDITDSDAYRRTPVLLGRITSIKGVPVEQAKVEESERWVVDRETRMTYLADQPKDAVLTSGKWWAPGYTGPILAVIEEGAAKGMHLSVGDGFGLRIFGRDLEAKVSAIQRIDWGGFGANTAITLSPGIISAANPQHFAIAKVPPEKETPIIAAVGRQFPDIVIFQTREALATAADVFRDVSVAVNAAASVVTIAGLMVLAGALASIARKRRVESALLKTLGATRGRVLLLYAAEFAFAGAVGAVLGVAMGVLASWPVVLIVFEAKWAAPWGWIIGISSLATLTAALGGAGVGAALLNQRPAQVLRAQ
jgi:putative ABC transport system permease protein